MPSYTCPDCNAKVKSAAEAKPGQQFTCPECDATFTPRAGTIAFKDDPPARAKPAAAKPAAARPAAAKPRAAAAPASPPPPAEPEKKSPFADDDDDGPKTYGLA